MVTFPAEASVDGSILRFLAPLPSLMENMSRPSCQPKCICRYIHIHVCMYYLYTYIYIYLYLHTYILLYIQERDSLFLYVHVYIYIYTHTRALFFTPVGCIAVDSRGGSGITLAATKRKRASPKRRHFTKSTNGLMKLEADAQGAKFRGVCVCVYVLCVYSCVSSKVMFFLLIAYVCTVNVQS